MSIGIHIIPRNCYYVDVNAPTSTSTWIMSKFLDWQRDRGSLASLAEFARYLEVGDKSLNTWIKGRNNPTYKTAVKICKKLNDFSLLGILGYSQPDGVFIPASLPSELQERLRLALGEISTTIKAKSLDPESDEALKLTSSILERYGLATISSIRKSG